MNASAWPVVTVHPSQFPELLGRQVRDAIRARRIPSKFHYLTPQQGRRWLDVHAAYAPSAGAVRATDMAYERAFANAAEELAGRAVQIVSLGCGGGHKDALLARALAAAGCQVSYLAVDAGQSLVLTAAERVGAIDENIRVRRLVADLDGLDVWRAYIEADAATAVQIFCAFGIVPNADPERLLTRIARWARPGDRLLMSANLLDPSDPAYDLTAIAPQYDNPPTRRWLATFFADLDLPVGAADLVFSLEPAAAPARIAVTVELREACQVDIDGEALSLPAGAHFDVFFSQRFQRHELTAILLACGFTTRESLETAPRAEAIWRVIRG